MTREKIEDWFNKRRMEASDREIKTAFKIILYQCKYTNREDTTLIAYIHELEYRGIKYRL